MPVELKNAGFGTIVFSWKTHFAERIYVGGGCRSRQLRTNTSEAKIRSLNESVSGWSTKTHYIVMIRHHLVNIFFKPYVKVTALNPSLTVP